MRPFFGFLYSSCICCNICFYTILEHEKQEKHHPPAKHINHSHSFLIKLWTITTPRIRSNAVAVYFVTKKKKKLLSGCSTFFFFFLIALINWCQIFLRYPPSLQICTNRQILHKTFCNTATHNLTAPLVLLFLQLLILIWLIVKGLSSLN